MTQPQTFYCRMLAPIPVGHRVEITGFKREAPALFGKGDQVLDEDEPYIRDLDSGIVYTVPWHHTGKHFVMLSDRYGDAVAPNIQPTAQVVGRVVACRVVTISPETSSATSQLQTYLTVAPP